MQLLLAVISVLTTSMPGDKMFQVLPHAAFSASFTTKDLAGVNVCQSAIT